MIMNIFCYKRYLLDVGLYVKLIRIVYTYSIYVQLIRIYRVRVVC